MTNPQQHFDHLKKLTERLDLNFALQAAGLGVWELDPFTNQLHWDDRCRALFGLSNENELSYQQAIRYIHPEDVDRVDQAVKWAMNPDSGGHYDQTYRTLGATDSHLRWVRFYGQGYFDQAGQVVRFAGVGQEVTLQVADRQAAEQQAAELQAVLESIPEGVYIGTVDGITLANQAALNQLGFTTHQELNRHVATLAEEIQTRDGQTGELIPVHQQAFVRALGGERVVQDVRIRHRITHQERVIRCAAAPVLLAGKVIAAVAVNTDVTEQERVRQALEASEATLQSIIELAELGSYTIEVATNQLTKSARVADWYGLPNATDVATSLRVIQESDRARVEQVLTDALQPGSTGDYQVEYTVQNALTGRHHILRTNGKVRWNAEGQPLRVEGAVLDITAQRELQLALEQQVQQRTEELAAINKKLEANNQELEETNKQLMRSNENLQTFAYIASHDLQEPLRKIQQFGDLLRTSYASPVREELLYIDRMQSAASRMSTLIKDLLDFSRISTQRDAREKVSLSDVLRQVLSTLEQTIQETGAQVSVEPLPTVLGDTSQLEQLFQNLLANALKFRRPGVVPQIAVKAGWLSSDHLPKGINPGRGGIAYHRIDVADNGIGFEEKYLDRIFQVFQRLHGKSAYGGTGIGLAICEKVVANHGGAITATSQPGQGATFTIYLPA